MRGLVLIAGIHDALIELAKSEGISIEVVDHPIFLSAPPSVIDIAPTEEYSRGPLRPHNFQRGNFKQNLRRVKRRKR